MMTRLVVVMRDAGNSAAEDAQTCRVPAPCERDSFVFTATECGPLRLRNFYARHFRPAVARARLPKQLRFHDLRHPCAALLIANGRHMEEMKDHLGHSSIRVTSDRCGHLFPRAPQETPTGSTRLTGMQPRPAGPTCGRYATSASPEHAGRSESLNRAFSGGCEYPVEEPPPKRALEESEAGGQDRGLPHCSVGPPTASDTADESGAGRIRPAASRAYAHRGLGTGNRAWRPQRTRTEHRARTRDLGRRTGAEPALGAVMTGRPTIDCHFRHLCSGEGPRPIECPPNGATPHWGCGVLRSVRCASLSRSLLVPAPLDT